MRPLANDILTMLTTNSLIDRSRLQNDIQQFMQKLLRCLINKSDLFELGLECFDGIYDRGFNCNTCFVCTLNRNSTLNKLVWRTDKSSTHTFVRYFLDIA